jgi:hypothetical protein
MIDQGYGNFFEYEEVANDACLNSCLSNIGSEIKNERFGTFL